MDTIEVRGKSYIQSVIDEDPGSMSSLQLAGGLGQRKKFSGTQVFFSDLNEIDPCFDNPLDIV